MSVFQTVKAHIDQNPFLYAAQINAYNAALSHYSEFKDSAYRESLIVMPTGSGKTGVMSILPFGISNGRVLIIAPGKIIRKTVYRHLDSSNSPERTFWIKQKIILEKQSLPKTFLYTGFNPKNEAEKVNTVNNLTDADIVITNVQKLGSSNDEINLMNLVEEDFFDMIIIDEAHHVAAAMWKDALNYFKASKVVKLTATPFRSDKKEISAHPYDPIYEYTLGEAINDGLIKDIVKHEDIPGTITFVDQDTKKTYSLQEAKEELGNDFVSKSIAMDEACSKEVIQRTKKILEVKRASYPHHQVLAVTCNDQHAQDVCQWFADLDFRATYVSTRTLTEKEIERRLTDFANGEYDVMVSIQMLGEGYDNPNISIISLFRPFKTMGPYAQAIGRGLRKIHQDNLTDIDNFCNVVYHQELNLEKLWEYYKEQETFGQIIKRQRESISEQLTFTFDELGFVEKKPSRTAVPSPEDDDWSTSIVPNALNVSSYSSQGLGNEDAFTQGGMDSYKLAYQQVIEKQQKEVEERKAHIDRLHAAGAINEAEAELLKRNAESKAQSTVNQNFDNFHDRIVSTALRGDYINWLNLKVEEFFKSSLLTKEGTELFEDRPVSGVDKVNNLGYIIKNMHKSFSQETGKTIALYTASDFANAKVRFVEKMEFLWEQYGKKEELD